MAVKPQTIGFVTALWHGLYRGDAALYREAVQWRDELDRETLDDVAFDLAVLACGLILEVARREEIDADLAAETLLTQLGQAFSHTRELPAAIEAVPRVRLRCPRCRRVDRPDASLTLRCACGALLRYPRR